MMAYLSYAFSGATNATDQSRTRAAAGFAAGGVVLGAIWPQPRWRRLRN